MKRKRLILFLWLLVIAIAVMIFMFSAQGGDESMQTSGGVVTFLLETFYPGFKEMNWKQKVEVFDQVQYYARKGAHFTEFAMFGASVNMLFRAKRMRWTLPLAWVAGALYACSDELHQLLVGTRTASWQDVALDSCGVLFGVLVVMLINRLIKRRKAS